MWQYDVRMEGSPLAELEVDARFAAAAGRLRVDRDAARFAHDVQYEAGGRWERAQGGDAGWAVPCETAGCHVRYRFALRAAAEAIDDVETAAVIGDVVIAPPSTWLLRPDASPSAARFRFHLAPSARARFAAGTFPSPDGAADTFEASTDGMEAASFAVFGGFLGLTLERGAARIEVAVAPQSLALSEEDTVGWIRSSVDAVAAYFGAFPSKHVLVVVMAGGPGPMRGETLGDGGPAVLLRVGSDVRASALRDDWVAVHELLHAVLPSLPRQHTWLSEGIASYAEPVVRVRAGLLTPEKMWGDLVEGMPQGLPEAGDEGLERTHTWGRTYWGGALFCLVADVTIRERTGNKRSFDDVLRVAAKVGGDASKTWDIERWLDEGDRVTGTGVMNELYRDLGMAPGRVDLPALWARLGVRRGDRGVSFDDGAPLAAVRSGITSGP